jgi:hypothetical protein
LDSASGDFVDHRHFERAWSFGKRPGDPLVVHDGASHHNSLKESGVEIRLLESASEPLPELAAAVGLKGAGEFEELGVIGIHPEQGFEIPGIVGIELTLNYRFGVFDLKRGGIRFGAHEVKVCLGQG